MMDFLKKIAKKGGTVSRNAHSIKTLLKKYSLSYELPFVLLNKMSLFEHNSNIG